MTTLLTPPASWVLTLTTDVTHCYLLTLRTCALTLTAQGVVAVGTVLERAAATMTPADNGAGASTLIAAVGANMLQADTALCVLSRVTGHTGVTLVTGVNLQLHVLGSKVMGAVQDTWFFFQQNTLYRVSQRISSVGGPCLFLFL